MFAQKKLQICETIVRIEILEAPESEKHYKKALLFSEICLWIKSCSEFSSVKVEFDHDCMI